MQILYTNSNIFDLPENASHAVCVTTNGIVKANGKAVMGAGIAKEADDRFSLAGLLGEYLRKYGNRAFHMGAKTNAKTGNQLSIITFPTKYDWREDSSLGLIQQSAENLIRICGNRNISKIYLPPVGCGKGRLDWESQVCPLLEPMLDDRFTVVFRRNT